MSIEIVKKSKGNFWGPLSTYMRNKRGLKAHHIGQGLHRIKNPSVLSTNKAGRISFKNR